LPKLGRMRYRNSRLVLGDVRSVTVSERCGRWYVSILTRQDVALPEHTAPSSIIGIDVGITRFATLSDATSIDPLNSFRTHEARLARAQRSLSRKVHGSQNYSKQHRRVARIHARIGDARQDFLHKLSSTISKTHAVVVVEDLQVKQMSASARGTAARPGRRVRQKAGLNKSILDQGWGEFRRQLEYKCEWAGGRLIAVPPAFTSQTCPPAAGGCGHVAEANRTSQAAFRCMACGYAENADVVGALNIRARGIEIVHLEAAGLAASACGGRAQSGGPSKQEPTEAAFAVQVAA
jgi:putative transposase